MKDLVGKCHRREGGDLYSLPRLSRNATWREATVHKNDHVGVGPAGFDCNIEFHLVRHVYGDLSSVEAQTTVVLRWGLTRFPDNKEANKI